jgi:ribose transport system permease protein
VSAIPQPSTASESTAILVWRRLAALQARFPILQLIALGAVFGYGAASLPGLSSWGSIKQILVLASLAGLASAGQTLLILMGGFDLSISGFIVSSALVVSVLKEKWDVPFWVAIVIGVIAAALLGGLAGQICHRFQIQPLIVTLAMGTIALGLIQVQTEGSFSGTAPDWLIRLTSPGTDTFGSIGIPPLVVMWAAVAVLMALYLHRTTPGRRVMATGANPRAAEYSLINTRRVWTLAFAFSGIVSALVGILVAGFSGSVDSGVGDPYLFQSVVAVIVGGTVFGGPGDYTRTIVGALFLTVVNVVLVGHGATPADQNMIYGAAILIAVAIYGRERRLRDRI